MVKIFKYPVRPLHVNELMMPEGARVLSFEMQGVQPTVWAMVDPDKEMKKKCIAVVGTGNSLHDCVMDGKFIGTVMDGNFVWHAFELSEESFKEIE